MLSNLSKLTGSFNTCSLQAPAHINNSTETLEPLTCSTKWLPSSKSSNINKTCNEKMQGIHTDLEH